jgi:hypothetical protein
MHTDSSRLARCSVALVVALLMGTPATAQTEADYIAARDEIWAKEQAIYAGRGRGDLSIYVNSTSPHYKGWPPGAKVPTDLSGLKGMASAMTGLDKERLEMELADFALSGDTAVIYYHTHRTVLPNGEPTDQRYAICHVWTREDGEWKLIGALGRLKPANEIR